MSWAICFLVATSWESAYRIFAEYASWGVEQTIVFMIHNLGIALALSIILAILHKGLLTIAVRFDKNRSLTGKLLLPEIGLAAATLLSMVIWVLRYRFPFLGAPIIVRDGVVYVTIALGFIGCMLLARWIHSRVLSRIPSPTLVQISIAAILGPVLIVSVLQWTRDSGRPAVERSENSAPYIILISVDTLRWDYLGVYGSPSVQTPVIDSIAAEGATFKNAVTQMPLTGPSHMSMLTGLPPLIHGVLMNGFILPRGISTVTSYLLNAGYRTGGFISGYPLQMNNSRLDRGFQRYDDDLAWIDPFDGSYCGRFVSELSFLTKDLARDARFTTDSALQWLEKNADSHFFLFLHYYDPHFPYGGNINSSYDSRMRDLTETTSEDLPRQKKLYGTEVETVDAQIGRVVSFLKEKGVYDRSLLIFTSDHGENLGEHGLYYHHRGIYEQVIRIPLIIRYPGKLASGKVVSQQVAVTDIFRTILEAARLKSKETPESVDLVGLANGRFDSPHRVMVSNNFHKNQVRHSVRTNKWKLIRNDDKQRTYELYNLSTDPDELVDLYSEETEIARQLEVFLNRQLTIRTDSEIIGLSPAQIESLKSLGYIH